MGDNFRITGSRRDFLRLICNSDMYVTHVRGRFAYYKIKGQIHIKMSRRNLARYTMNDYIDHIATTDDGVKIYRATDRAHQVINEQSYNEEQGQ